MRLFLFTFIRGLLYIHKRINAAFWKWYHVSYCIARGVSFEDKNTVLFNSHSQISIGHNSNVSIGKYFIVNSGPSSGIGTSMSKISVANGATLRIGNYVGVSSTTILVNNSIVIGDYVNIGGGAFLTDSNHHSSNWEDRADRIIDIQNAKTAPIVIGDYVFIGARCMILKGVTIGEKTIIAAGSVVVNDIPANCIAGGNPCKVIKHIL